MTRLLFTGQALVIDTLKVSVTGQHNIPCQRAYEKDNYQVIGRSRMVIFCLPIKHSQSTTFNSFNLSL